MGYHNQEPTLIPSFSTWLAQSPAAGSHVKWIPIKNTYIFRIDDILVIGIASIRL